MESVINLENVAASVAEIRNRSGATRFPDEIWKKIRILRRNHTIEEIAKATGIAKSHICVKGRAVRGNFYEVKPLPAIAVNEKKETAVVEIKRPDGSELKLKFDCSLMEIEKLITDFFR